jgi:uncharacterized protein
MKYYKDIKPSKKVIKAYLASAQERIDSAKILLKEGNYRDAVSRAYYAFLDTARAALLTKGLVAKTHSDVLMLFGSHFGKNREIPVKFFRFYKQVMEAREEADYEILKKFKKEDAQSAIEMAEEFVKFIAEKINGTRSRG